MIQKFDIDFFPWGRPKVYPISHAEIEFRKDCIAVSMYADEKNPRGSITQRNGPVFQDSCMEFFLCPCPEISPAYFNFEINVLGTLYTGYSATGLREDSGPIDHSDFVQCINASASLDTQDGIWDVHFNVPYAFIQERIPRFNIETQSFITGNFYKCGDRTEYPHYAAWHPIDPEEVPRPNFHVPKFFERIDILRC